MANGEATPSLELAKGKTKTVFKPDSSYVTDKIVAVAHDMENMTKDQAITLIKELSDVVDYTYFRLGGALSVIQMNGWYHEEGHETFRAFVETEFGLHYRKAMYLVAIYNGLVQSNVPWEKVKGLGWTKLKELAHLITSENVDEWVKAAMSMTTIQLIEYIKEKEKGTLSVDGEPVTKPSDLTTMSFKVHADQKEIIKEAVEKAKNDAKTEYDSVALEGICMSYINEHVTIKNVKPLKQALKDHTWEEVLEVLSELHPKVNFAVKM